MSEETGSRAITEMGEPPGRIVLGPVMRSPAHRQHLILGAHFSREGGWEVPADYGAPAEERRTIRDSVGLADITAQGKVDLRGAIDQLVASLAVDLAPGSLAALPDACGRAVLARIASRWALILYPAEATQQVLKLLSAASLNLMVTEVSSSLAGFALAGPRAFDLLARLTAFDVSRLHPGSCAAVRLAHIWALLVRRQLPQLVAEAYFSSEYGRYAWETLLKCGRRLGARPVGWEALRAEECW